MSIESTRRVRLSWPTSSDVQSLAPSTVADVKAAFAAWVAELADQGCPDTAAAGYDHRFGLGGPSGLADLVAVWPAADSVVTTKPAASRGERACPNVHLGETIGAVFLARIVECPNCPGKRIITHEPAEVPAAVVDLEQVVASGSASWQGDTYVLTGVEKEAGKLTLHYARGRAR